ncbi:hypothetical protein OAM67_01845 [bacterium]|nr:hypothetical protein [bacterium]
MDKVITLDFVQAGSHRKIGVVRGPVNQTFNFFAIELRKLKRDEFNTKNLVFVCGQNPVLTPDPHVRLSSIGFRAGDHKTIGVIVQDASRASLQLAWTYEKQRKRFLKSCGRRSALFEFSMSNGMVWGIDSLQLHGRVITSILNPVTRTHKYRPQYQPKKKIKERKSISKAPRDKRINKQCVPYVSPFPNVSIENEWDWSFTNKVYAPSSGPARRKHQANVCKRQTKAPRNSRRMVPRHRFKQNNQQRQKYGR